MRTKRQIQGVTFFLAVTMGLALTAQVATNVPPVVPGAKPVTVEHIKIHGAALEGNLEGDAVDRDVIRLPAAQLSERETPPLSGRLRAAWLLHWRRAVDPRNPRAADDRRRLRPGREGDDCRSAGFEDDATTAPCIRVPSPPAISRSSSRTTWSRISTRITGRFPIAKAADWWATRWADTAQRGSA